MAKFRKTFGNFLPELINDFINMGGVVVPVDDKVTICYGVCMRTFVIKADESGAGWWYACWNTVMPKKYEKMIVDALGIHDIWKHAEIVNEEWEKRRGEV